MLLAGFGFNSVAQSGPVFVQHPDITVSCEEPVPALGECEASSPDCPGPVTITTLNSETGDVEKRCSLTPSKLGNSVAWAFWLSLENMPVERWKFVGPAYLEQYADGTAHLWGTIQNYQNASYKFEVSLWFADKRTWNEWSALGRGYRNDSGLSGENYLDWDYYELLGEFSTFTGIDGLVGNYLNIGHYPFSKYYGFQSGIGANNKNANPGFGGAFCYTGMILGEHCGAGVGHLSVNTACEEGPEGCASTAFTRICKAVDTCGNVAFHSQVINVVDDIAPTVDDYPSEVSVECGQHYVNFITATDNCSDVVITYTDQLVIPGCNNGQILRTYKISDGCGNFVNRTQTIHLIGGAQPEFILFPEDTEVSCSQIEDLDNIDIEFAGPCTQLALTHTDVITPGSCWGTYTLVRTFSLTDDCGNITTRPWTVSVYDNEAPVLSGVPANAALNCGDEIPEVNVTVEDNCDPTVVNVLLVATTEYTSCGYNFIRTWTATDACGNTAEAVQVITLTDQEPPVFTFIPADINLACSESGSGDDYGMAVATDDCLGVIVLFDDTPLQGNCGTGFIRTFTATDVCGNTATAVQTVSFTDEVAPVFSFIPSDITVNCGEEYELPDAVATDNCSSVSVTHEDEANEGCGGSFTRTYTATDGCGNTTTASVNVTVVDNAPPVVITSPDDVTVDCNNIPSLNQAGLEYSDECGSVTESLSESIVPTPGTCIGDYTIVREWTLTDDCGNNTVVTWNIHVHDNEAPMLEGVPSNIAINCGDPISEANVTATDNCDPNVNVTLVATTEFNDCGYNFIRTWTAVDQCGNTAQAVQVITLTDQQPPVFTFLPEDINLACSAGTSLDDLELATASDDCLGVIVLYEDEFIGGNCGDGIIRTFTATDACGNTITATQNITFTDEIAPVFTFVPSNITVNCGEEYELPDAIATDNCSSVIVTHEDEANAGCGGSFTRTYTATDGCGNTATESVSVNIVDNLPPVVISAPVDITVNCDNIPPAAGADLLFEDACGSVNVDFIEITVTTPGVCASDYLITRIWTLTDDCFNSTTVTWNIHVTDNVAPVLEGIPANIALNCGDAIPEVNVTASDNCDPNVSVTLVATTEFNDCGYNFIRTWTAIDQCGNTAQASQVIALTDQTPPVFTFIPEDVNLACSEGSSLEDLELATASDDCLGVIVLYEDEFIGGNCGAGIIRTFTATDACGNTITATQTITFTDNDAPVFTFVPDDITSSCGVNVELPSPTAIDNCSSVTITFEDTQLGGCGGFIRTYTATDGCNNSSQALVTVSINDDISPEFVDFPSDLNLTSCASIPSLESAGVTYADNCSDLEVEVAEVQVSNGCANSYTLTRTWTLTDACGNTAQRTWTIQVTDNQAPVISGIPANVELNCGESEEEINVTVTDNCSSTADIQIDYSEVVEDIDCGYILTRTWTATDECGNVSTASHVSTLTDLQEPEFTFVPANISIECGEDYVLEDPIAQDDCSNLTVTTEIEQLAGCAGSFKRIFTATDACGNVALAEQLIIITDTQNPVFLSTPQNVTVDCNSIPSLESAGITYTDNCGIPTLSVQSDIDQGDCPGNYEITHIFTIADQCNNRSYHTWRINVVDNSAPIFGQAPAVLVLDCGAVVPPLQVTATDNCSNDIVYTNSEVTNPSDCGYQIIRTRTATDACGNVAIFTQTVTVEDFAPPVFSFLPQSITLDCSEELPSVVMPTAEDECSGSATVTMEESSIQGTCPGSYTLYRLFKSSDACGNEAMHLQTINVGDMTGPEFINFEPEITIDCSQSNTPFVIVVDNCNSSTLTFTDEVFGSPCFGGIVRTYVATDVCGNSTTMQQMITLVDEESPEFIDFPSNIQVSCDNIPDVSSANVTYEDNCSEVDVVYSEIIEEGNCPNNYTIQRTWTIFDECFNSESRTWSIQVMDNTAPSILGAPDDMLIDCSENIPQANVIAIDNCDDGVSVSLFAVTIPQGCDELFIRRWVAMDACGNFTQAVQNVLITDMYAPELSSYPEDITLSCGGTIPDIPSVTATDNCLDNLVVDFTETTSGATNCPTITRTWCASDCIGNETCHTQTITFTNGAGLIANNMNAWSLNTQTARVEVTSAESDVWSLDVFDLNGKIIAPLYNGSINAGETRTFTFNPLTYGDAFYIVRYTNGKEVFTKKLIFAE